MTTESLDPSYWVKRNWREKNREKDRAAKLAWYYRNEARPYKSRIETLDDRRLRLQTKRQINQAHKFPGAQEALKQQQGLCAICGKPESVIRKGVVQRLSLDHCHKTGKFRGWLCLGCNIAVGSIERHDDVFTYLLKLRNYLSGS